MSFPDPKKLKKIREELEKSEGMKVISKNATQREKLRWEICQSFVRYANDNRLKNIELAESLGIDTGDISKILNHRIEKFSTDRLLDLLGLILPDHTIVLETEFRPG